MKLAPYLVCDSLCLAAYLATAFISCRDRLWVPMAYAMVCAFACAAASVGVAAPEFRAEFGRCFLPIILGGATLFALLEVQRWQTATAEEHLLAAALLCGLGASLCGGLLARPGYARLAVQTLAVVLPIALALVTIGPRPMPQLAPVPEWQPTMVSAPTPEVAL